MIKLNDIYNSCINADSIGSVSWTPSYISTFVKKKFLWMEFEHPALKPVVEMHVGGVKFTYTNFDAFRDDYERLTGHQPFSKEFSCNLT